MCGIAGQWSLTAQVPSPELTLRAVQCMRLRGPDAQRELSSGRASLGHARLSILDLSEAAHQPFSDETQRFHLVFNGEIFNFESLRNQLKAEGIQCRTQSDTEVLLHLFLLEGPAMLSKLNGFFAFAVYDKEENSIFLARDRYGVKPLYYTVVDQRLVFASELKALVAMIPPPALDPVSMQLYFRKGYIPGPYTIYQNVHHLMPGHTLRGKGDLLFAPEPWYQFPDPNHSLQPLPSYEEASRTVRSLVADAVKLRMVADVPVGAFLSGGVDSSVVVACAAPLNPQLHTFSIGYADEPFFDETRFAEAVAKHFGTQHTSFQLTNDDLLSALDDVLDYLDQPFADSSALPVHILSRKTRKNVTVALSGDGGDELFSGYHKHMGEFLIRQGGWKMSLARGLAPLTTFLPASRQHWLGNKVRQLQKLARVQQLGPRERYRQLAGVTDDAWISRLLTHPGNEDSARLQPFLSGITDTGTMNQVLEADMRLVLPFDMLTKVDLMSMANSLEVRSPLLDYRLVDFVGQLPESYKIDRHRKKKLLIDAFKADIPEVVYNRPKHGFEVPLLKWFRGPLKSRITTLLNDETLFPSAWFNRAALDEVLRALDGSQPKEVSFKIWSLLVWAHWYQKNR